MIQKSRIMLIGLLLIVSSSLFATHSWYLGKHSKSPSSLKNQISAKVKKGYIPMGISESQGNLYILYYINPDFAFSRWAINWYKNADTLKDGITSRMNDGYFPTGISYTGNRFYVLFIKRKNGAKAWRLQPSAKSMESIKAAIQPYVSDTYVPVGITLYQNRYWTLLVKVPDTTIKRWYLESYKASNAIIKKYLDKRVVDEKWFPWGFMYRGSKAHVLYVR